MDVGALVLTIIAPVFILASVGFCWARLGNDYPSEFLSKLVMNVGAPCLFLSTMTSSGIQLQVLGEVVVAAVLVLALMGVIGWILISRLGLKTTVYLPPLLFPNNGNMGLSLCLYTFGEEGLALALGIFMVMAVMQFTVGVMIADENAPSPLNGLINALGQPVVLASFASVACIALDYQLPEWLFRSVSLMGQFTIPIMLLTLGVSLSHLSVKNMRSAVLLSLMRLGGGFMAGVAVAELLGFEGAARGVVILQSTMPAAVFNYLIAVRYKGSPSEVAGVVVTSTVMSFATLPFVIAYLINY